MARLLWRRRIPRTIFRSGLFWPERSVLFRRMFEAVWSPWHSKTTWFMPGPTRSRNISGPKDERGRGPRLGAHRDRHHGLCPRKKKTRIADDERAGDKCACSDKCIVSGARFPARGHRNRLMSPPWVGDSARNQTSSLLFRTRASKIRPLAGCNARPQPRVLFGGGRQTSWTKIRLISSNRKGIGWSRLQRRRLKYRLIEGGIPASGISTNLGGPICVFHQEIARNQTRGFGFQSRADIRGKMLGADQFELGLVTRENTGLTRWFPMTIPSGLIRPAGNVLIEAGSGLLTHQT